MKRTVYLLLLFLLAGCNFPLRSKITPTPNITQAYETIVAQMGTMQASGTGLPSSTPIPGITSTALPGTLFPTQPIKTALPSTQLVPTQVCDRVLPGNPIDVTIPDDTNIVAGEGFTKTWRLQNGGACSWTREYKLIWVSGERMADVDVLALPQAVPPGQTTDLSLDMTAPSTGGTYQSNWMLQNANGVFFGIGPNGKSPFWVRIVVQPKGTPTPQPSATAIQPGIVFSGVVTLLNGQSINLSNGNISNDTNLDLSMKLGEISATNSSTFSAVLNNPPDYSICKNQSYSGNAIALTESNLYGYFCVKNSRNQLSTIQILGYTTDSTLTLEIQTWGAE